MRGRERGLAASVEAAIILPVLVLFLGLLITLARVAIAQQQIDSAAAAGARAASLERTATRAEGRALDAVSAALGSSGTPCAATATEVSADAVARPIGTAGGTVVVHLECEVSLADVALPFIPGSVEIHAARSSPVDPLRGR